MVFAVRMKFPPIFLILSFLLLLPALANAQVINAASCSESDVQAALDSVTASTTTVNIPAGTCNWSSQIIWSVPSGNTSLSIIGAGSLTTLGGGDATVIKDDDSTDSNYLLNITTAGRSSFLRIAGLSIESDTGTFKDNGILEVNGTPGALRIDHDHFFTSGANRYAYEVIRLTGWPVGVAFQNLFDGGSAFQIMGGSFEGDTSGAGYESWAYPSNFGSGNAFFVENNVFDFRGYTGQSNAYADDCFDGGRFVYRFNTFENVGLQDHPTGGSGQWRGCRTEEIYENIYSGSTSNPTFTAFFDSSGTSLVWGNSALTGYENFIYLLSDRTSDAVYKQSAPPNGWGYCGTSFSGTDSPWDGNTNPTTGYPCLDQPGEGQSDLLANWFPVTVDTVTGTIAWPHQKLEPVYEWLNKYNPVPGYPQNNTVTDNAPKELAANRDYYQYTASFNGTSGVGSGPYASMPSTCTKGVAYWATDKGNWNQSGGSNPANYSGQGELYVCTATNTWSLYYEPYTYPDPLETSGAQPSPAAPLDLNGQVVQGP